MASPTLKEKSEIKAQIGGAGGAGGAEFSLTTCIPKPNSIIDIPQGLQIGNTPSSERRFGQPPEITGASGSSGNLSGTFSKDSKGNQSTNLSFTPDLTPQLKASLTVVRTNPAQGEPSTTFSGNLGYSQGGTSASLGYSIHNGNSYVPNIGLKSGNFSFSRKDPSSKPGDETTTIAFDFNNTTLSQLVASIGDNERSLRFVSDKGEILLKQTISGTSKTVELSLIPKTGNQPVLTATLKDGNLSTVSYFSGSLKVSLSTDNGTLPKNTTLENLNKVIGEKSAQPGSGVSLELLTSKISLSTVYSDNGLSAAAQFNLAKGQLTIASNPGQGIGFKFSGESFSLGYNGTGLSVDTKKDNLTLHLGSESQSAAISFTGAELKLSHGNNGFGIGVGAPLGSGTINAGYDKEKGFTVGFSIGKRQIF